MAIKTKLRTRLFFILLEIAIIPALFAIGYSHLVLLQDLSPSQIIFTALAAITTAAIASYYISKEFEGELKTIGKVFDISPEDHANIELGALYRETDTLIDQAHHWVYLQGRTVAALRESEERLNLTLSTGRFGTWDWDLVNDHMHWDARNHRLYGLKPGSFSGNYRDFVNLLHPDDRAILTEQLSRITEGSGNQPNEVEYRVIWPDGSIHVLADRCEVFRSNMNQIERMIGITWDITLRKQAEQDKNAPPTNDQ